LTSASIPYPLIAMAGVWHVARMRAGMSHALPSGRTRLHRSTSNAKAAHFLNVPVT
jgi:hypothetical protein